MGAAATKSIAGALHMALVRRKLIPRDLAVKAYRALQAHPGGFGRRVTQNSLSSTVTYHWSGRDFSLSFQFETYRGSLIGVTTKTFSGMRSNRVSNEVTHYFNGTGEDDLNSVDRADHGVTIEGVTTATFFGDQLTPVNQWMWKS